MRSYRIALLESLRNDPHEVETYLEATMEAFREDGDEAALLAALRTIADSHKTL